MGVFQVFPARMRGRVVARASWLIEQWWRYGIVLLVLVSAAVMGRAASFTIIALLVAAAAGLLILREPRYGLLLLPAIALLVPFEIGTGTEVSLNLAVLAVPALTALWLVPRLLSHDKIQLATCRLNRPLIAFLLIVLFSLFRGNSMWDPAVPRPAHMIVIQLGQIGIYVLSFLSFWLTANSVVDPAWLRRIAYAVVATGGFVVSVLLFLRGLPIGGLFNLGGVWIVALSLALFLYDRQLKHWQRALLFLVLAETMVRLWFFGRDWYAGWVPPLATIGAIVWWHSSRSRWLIVLGVVLMVVVIGPFYLLEELNWEAEWESSGDSRLVMWKSVIELASQSPLLGLGPAAYRYYHYLKPLAYGGAMWFAPTISAHNMFVDLFAQLGLLGVVCYIWILVEGALLARKLYTKCTGFARGYALAMRGALIGVVLADMFAANFLPFVYNVGFQGFQASVLGWMLLGGLAVLENSDPKLQRVHAAEGL
jgi:hypothetical protein